MHGRALVALAVAWAAVAGCAQVWGIGDVPVPIDATTSDGAPDSMMPANGDTQPPPETAVADTGARDAPAPDSTLADISSGDTSRPDASSADTTPGDALADASADAPPAIDAGCPTDSCLMASGLNNPFAIVSDETNVYWTEFGSGNGAADGTVKSCPVAGCGAGPNVIASGLQYPRGIAIDGANVYFATASLGSVQGTISSCPLTGCGAAFPTVLSPAGIPQQVAVDQTYVYWADSDLLTVNRVPKIGGASSPLNDAASSLFLEAQYVAVDGTYLFVSDSNQAIVRMPIDGGAQAQIARGFGGGDSPLALDQANIYYAGNSRIFRALKTSTDGGPAISPSLAHLIGLSFDADAGAIYWADFGTGNGPDGTVGKVTADGGAFKLGSGLVTPQGVTVSGSHVFWISMGTYSGIMNVTLANTGTLNRLAK